MVDLKGKQLFYQCKKTPQKYKQCKSPQLAQKTEPEKALNLIEDTFMKVEDNISNDLDMDNSISSQRTSEKG